MTCRDIVFVAVICTVVLAHDFAVEKQRVRKSNRGNPHINPNDPDEDFSFEYPANVMKDTTPLLDVQIPPFGPPFVEVFGDPRPDLGIAYRGMLYHEYDKTSETPNDNEEVDPWKPWFGYHKKIVSDVDWYKIDLTSYNVTGLKFIFCPASPFCATYKYFAPAVGLIGRTNVTDLHGNHIFLTDVDVPFNLTDGFGIHIKRHPPLSESSRRNRYCSPHTDNCIFLPDGIIDGGCIEGLKDLNETNTERINQGLEPCDDSHVVNVEIGTSDVYYAVIWDDCPNCRRTYLDDCLEPSWGGPQKCFKFKQRKENDYTFIYGYREPIEGTIAEKRAYWFKVLNTSPYRGNNKQTTFECLPPYDDEPYPTPTEH